MRSAFTDSQWEGRKLRPDCRERPRTSPHTWGTTPVQRWVKTHPDGRPCPKTIGFGLTAISPIVPITQCKSKERDWAMTPRRAATGGTEPAKTLIGTPTHQDGARVRNRGRVFVGKPGEQSSKKRNAARSPNATSLGPRQREGEREMRPKAAKCTV